jgi:transcriptional regulator with XRE-family HTH domain
MKIKDYMRVNKMKTILDEYLEDEEFRRLFAQEDLILEVTEILCELLEKEKISRKELADRLGKTKGFISQLLGGGRNLTLRTVADILHVLGYKFALKPEKLEKHRRDSNVVKFPESQTIFQSPQFPKYIHDPELEDCSKADNYSKTKKASCG